MAEKTQMTRLRIWFVNSVIVVMLGLSIYPIIADKEHWPFSQYSMYAQAEQNWSLAVIRLVGITNESETVPLQSFDYIQPFNQSRQRVAFEQLLRSSGSQTSGAIKDALKDCLLRYEKLRLAGLHDGPPLRGVRLYRFYWSRLDPQARNVDHPDRKELIDEILLPEAQL